MACYLVLIREKRYNYFHSLLLAFFAFAIYLALELMPEQRQGCVGRFFHFFETTTFYSSRGPDFLVQDWNRTTKSGTTGQEYPSPERTKGVFNEHHYTVREVADLWNL